MTDLNGKVIDVVYGSSFAAEKYGIRGLAKSLCKCKNNVNKSAYNYRWFDLEYYNNLYGTSLKI